MPHANPNPDIDLQQISTRNTFARHVVAGFAAGWPKLADWWQALDDALGHVRAEQDAGRITPAEAAAERVGLLERHIAECRRLRGELPG